MTVEDTALNEYLNRTLFGAKQHFKNQKAKEESAKYRDADDICYANSARIKKQNDHAKKGR